MIFVGFFPLMYDFLLRSKISCAMIVSIMLVFFVIDGSSGLFFTSKEGKSDKKCCKQPNLVADSTKANRGRALMKNLFTDPSTVPDLNPSDICDFMHFLFQQMTIERKTKDTVESMKRTRFPYHIIGIAFF